LAIAPPSVPLILSRIKNNASWLATEEILKVPLLYQMPTVDGSPLLSSGYTDPTLDLDDII
jgi:hypothetical protein